MFLKKKGQSTLEYAVLIAIVVAALLAIQIYMKRGISGRLKSASDDIGEQFEANKTTSTFVTQRSGKTVEVTTAGTSKSYAGGTSEDTGEVFGSPETVKRKGTETIDKW